MNDRGLLHNMMNLSQWDTRLSDVISDYEERPGQLEMMGAVHAALEGREVLLVEAGTGVGKSLAYLVPAILSGEVVIISTGTKALQEQLFHKDIPLVERVLERPVQAAILKGRTNYLCLEKMDQLVGGSDHAAVDRAWLTRIQAWSISSRSGDRAELDALPEDAPIWPMLSTSAEGCIGQECTRVDDCFVMKARRRAWSADVVVVNHHLFFADLGLREDAGFSLLPESGAVIFDEAHHLPDVAATHFGQSMSDHRLRSLTNDVAQRVRSLTLTDFEWDALLVRVDGHIRTFFSRLSEIASGSRTRLSRDQLTGDVIESYHLLDTALEALQGRCSALATADEMMARFAIRTQLLRDELNSLVELSNTAQVTWLERGDRAVFIRSAPVDVGPDLATSLFARFTSVIMTSATLSTGGTFSHIRDRLGLQKERREGVQELIVQSPFDYEHQVLLYTAHDLPDPREPGFSDALAARIEALVELTGGRTFVLCTTVFNMKRLHQMLSPRIPYPTLIQGQGSKAAILDAFRATPGSVLFATNSFWEGVDVVGEDLSQVIIDKLPFAPPDDPMVAARIECLKEEGMSPFKDFQVPQAIIALKQGFGRLIRHRSDVGIVSILDRRLSRSGYGKLFLRSLPPARLVKDFKDLESLWETLALRGESSDPM